MIYKDLIILQLKLQLISNNESSFKLVTNTIPSIVTKKKPVSIKQLVYSKALTRLFSTKLYNCMLLSMRNLNKTSILNTRLRNAVWLEIQQYKFTFRIYKLLLRVQDLVSTLTELLHSYEKLQNSSNNSVTVVRSRVVNSLYTLHKKLKFLEVSYLNTRTLVNFENKYSVIEQFKAYYTGVLITLKGLVSTCSIISSQYFSMSSLYNRFMPIMCVHSMYSNSANNIRL